MKTTESKENQNKKFSNYVLTFLLSVIFTLNISAKISMKIDTLSNSWNIEKHQLEKALITNLEDLNSENVEINDIIVIELEEEVELGIDTSNYLPENFNALKGKNDLDWNTIELIELEEEIEINFDTKDYLPYGFDPYKAMEKHTLKVVMN